MEVGDETNLVRVKEVMPLGNSSKSDGKANLYLMASKLAHQVTTNPMGFV
ncbi:TPA: hypothetical protein TXN49_001940 [Streptococcus suis]|nr:hypothetical protein [Streptococcus suis]